MAELTIKARDLAPGMFVLLPNDNTPREVFVSVTQPMLDGDLTTISFTDVEARTMSADADMKLITPA